jgi:hypothetical protein
MAGPAPKTKLWNAHENEHKPAGLHLLVGGQVEVSDANKVPVLKETKGDGNTLALDLTVVTCSDPAIKAKVWKAASYHKEVSANQFSKVAVRWDTKTIATFPVIDDRERAALMDEQADKQNAVAEKKSAAKKAAAKAKKAAKKVAKTVAKAAKKVVKAAKKVAKSVSKKVAKTKTAAKKATKKPAKKAAPKKAAKKAKKAKRR